MTVCFHFGAWSSNARHLQCNTCFIPGSSGSSALVNAHMPCSTVTKHGTCGPQGALQVRVRVRIRVRVRLTFCWTLCPALKPCIRVPCLLLSSPYTIAVLSSARLVFRYIGVRYMHHCDGALTLSAQWWSFGCHPPLVCLISPYVLYAHCESENISPLHIHMWAICCSPALWNGTSVTPSKQLFRIYSSSCFQFPTAQGTKQAKNPPQ